MQREIEELAAAGRAKAAEAKAEAEAKAAEKPDDDGFFYHLVNDNFDRLTLVGSMTRWARLPVWGPWMLLLGLGPLGAAFAWIFEPGPGAAVLTAVVAVLLVGPVLVWRRAWRANLAWRDRLPFELARYPECFGWEAKRYMTVVVSFVRPPPRKTLEDVVAGAMLQTKLGEPGEDGTSEHVFRIWVENEDASFGALTRVWLNEWIHDLVDRILRPLHDAYGIRRADLGQ